MRTVRCRTVANTLSIGLAVLEVVPVLGGEVEEGEERVPVSLQAGDGLLVLRPVFLHEGVERERGRRPVGARVISFRSLLTCSAMEFGTALRTLTTLCTQQRWWAVEGNTSSRAFQKPRPHRRRRFGADDYHQAPSIEDELPPALGALTRADLEADEFLLALRRGADHHQHVFRDRLMRACR